MNADPAAPATKPQLTLMIWVAVFPTLVVLQLLLSGVLAGAPMILRTLVMTGIAVPVVVFVLMPPLQRLRAFLISR
ncbi:hypothetical protein Val02_71190 [Virgisporangium aliadipatigenens]|uniref:Uncharacterized protein n=1 Tax=Virgisporangium aliadipatigenens TaxID=741659 RepID=A0A8J4DUN0_9ACTN|nr:hypothetical protein [Virgisporangium aliadipatigenens]GIJ50233.1 hypothetical protein Val02_71190 [Virgisporangium aliadipatigenens]